MKNLVRAVMLCALAACSSEEDTTAITPESDAAASLRPSIGLSTTHWSGEFDASRQTAPPALSFSGERLAARKKKIQSTNHIFEFVRYAAAPNKPSRLAPIGRDWVVTTSLQNTEDMLVFDVASGEHESLGRVPLISPSEGSHWVWPRLLDLITLDVKTTTVGDTEKAISADILMSVSVFDGGERKRCQFVFVKTLRVDLSGENNHKWLRDWFESPCIPEAVGTNHSWESGGGLAVVPPSLRKDPDVFEFIVALGHFQAMGRPWYDNLPHSQKKFIMSAVHIVEGEEPQVYADGLRNTQGITFVKTGKNDYDLIGTDHGPYSGDEINRIQRGGWYGWPMVSFGTRYDHNDTRFAPQIENAHPAGVAPIYYFSETSIAASPIIQVRDEVFENGWVYREDYGLSSILVGLMARGTLVRLVYDGERVLSQETIELGFRPRSLIELGGRIVIASDDGFIGVMTPTTVWLEGRHAPIEAARAIDVASSDLAPAAPAATSESQEEMLLTAADTQNGKLIFARCSACHSLEASDHSRVGPSLHGVFGRRPSEYSEYDGYSDALLAADPIWTTDTLDEFLAGPTAYIPGSSMLFRGISDDADRRDLIGYLREAATAP